MRWKKASLENCPGVPCVVTPPAPSFTCGTSTITDIDNNIYSTVSIGAQCWTKENLKVTRYNDGSVIPDLTNSISNPWATATSEARTEYVAAGVTGYVGTYGYLYNWYAVTDSRKLCPAGWHVPTDAEWTIMIKTLDPSQAVTSVNVLTFVGVQSATAGTIMKENSSLWSTNLGTNTSGFSVLPGGFRYNDGSFLSIRNCAFFWSGTVTSISNVWYRRLNYFDGSVDRDSFSKTFGASVRCLRD